MWPNMLRGILLLGACLAVQVEAAAVGPWQQCGGSSNGSPAGDVASSTCPAGYYCLRSSAYYWQCVQGTAPVSSPPVSPPPATPAPATTPAAPATTAAAPVVTTAAPVPTTTAVPAKTPPTPSVTAAATPSPPATTAATPAPVGGAQVQPAYAQCGGTSNCGSFGPCSDQAWTNAACTAGQTCTRSNAYYWQCTGTPTPPNPSSPTGTPAQTAAPATASTTPSPAPTTARPAISSAAPATLSPAPSTAQPVPSTAAPVPTTTAASTAGPQPTVALPTTPSPVASTRTLAAYSQCGGSSGCNSDGPCGDNAWTTVVCPGGQVCSGTSRPWYWQCVPGSQVSTAAPATPSPPPSPNAPTPSPPNTPAVVTTAAPGPPGSILSCLSATGATIVTNTSNLSAYNSGRQVWNLRVLHIPLAIAYAASTVQVQGIVQCAQLYNVKAVPRSGGHSYEGYGVQDNAILVDLSNMNSVAYATAAKTTVKVQSGNRLGPLYLALWNLDSSNRQTIPAGTCPYVGTGGHLLGGGFGYISRAYGLACDTIAEVEVVLADGTVVVANANNNSDLLWASQGGGGGSFGIITSYTLNTVQQSAHPEIGGTVTAIIVSWSMSNMYAVVNWYQNNAKTWPNIITTDILIGFGSVQWSGVWLGSNADLQTWLASSGYNALGSPQTASFQESDFITSALLFATRSMGLQPSNSINSLALGPGTSIWAASPFKAKSLYAYTAITTAGLNVIASALQSAPSNGYIQLHVYGGVISAIPNTATAFAHRDALMNLQFYVSWSDSSQQASCISWVTSFYNNLAPYVSTESYVNYIDADQPSWQSAYFPGTTFNQLTQIKSKYDPSNFFSNPQSIPTTSAAG